MFYVHGKFIRNGMKFLTGMQRNLQQMPGVRWVGARFSRIPAHYPDPENPGHYMNVFKTPTTLNDGQQQPVDDFER